MHVFAFCILRFEPRREKTGFLNMRKKKNADQLRGNGEADQRLCFRYTDSTIPLLPKSDISSLYAFSVTAQPSLCRTRSETPKTGFLRTRLILCLYRLEIVTCYLHVAVSYFCLNIGRSN